MKDKLLIAAIPVMTFFFCTMVWAMESSARWSIQPLPKVLIPAPHQVDVPLNVSVPSIVQPPIEIPAIHIYADPPVKAKHRVCETRELTSPGKITSFTGRQNIDFGVRPGTRSWGNVEVCSWQ